MSFLERRLSRREALAGAAILASGGIAAVVFGCNGESSEQANRDVIKESWQGGEISRIVANGRNYDVFTFEEGGNPTDHSIKFDNQIISDVYVRADQDKDIRISLLLSKATDIGAPFAKTQTPYPAFLLRDREPVTLDSVIPTSGYSFVDEYLLRNPNDNKKTPTKDIWLVDLDFPVRARDLAGEPFIIHLNGGLLKVGAQNSPQITLPARFKINPSVSPKSSRA